MQTEKKHLTTVEPHPKPQGLSLPIDDRIWVQQKLRDERNKEYKLFLQKQAQTRKLNRRTPPITSTPGQSQASNDGCISFLNIHTNTSPPHGECPASRKDAATLTEAVHDGKRTDTWESGQQRWRRRRWQLPRLQDSFSSEEELISDREEELEFRPRRRRVRQILHGRRAREHRVNRTPEDTKEGDAPVLHDQNNNKWVENLNDTQSEERMRTAVSSQPTARIDEAEFATGLIIGAREEQKSSQMKKEQYRQELLEQIAEQKRNKIREKELELRVVATRATDLEKQPDRIKQFAASNQQRNNRRQNVPQTSGVDLDVPVKDSNPRSLDDKVREDKDLRTSLGECHTDISPALGQAAPRPVQGVSLLAGFNEDYHRDFSNMLGEVAMPRVPAAPPSVPAAVPNSYKTPYDEAYYYYGARNPLVHNLSHNHTALPEGAQHSRNPNSPQPRPAPLRASGRTQASNQHGWTPLTVGELSDNAKERREKAVRYQEALKQQIEEREQLKRREREEKQRYDAKIEAEMMAYDPWGKSGGGASIKDQNGNLVSDLKQMHRINEMNRNRRQMQSFLKSSDHTPEDEARPPLSQLPGHSDQKATQKLHMNDELKELRQQMEEKKRRQEEEKERMRIEDEKEEKRLAEQRARMLQEYEEDQGLRKAKQKGISILEPVVQHLEEKKKVRQKQEVEKKVLQSSREQEEKRDLLSFKREPSPPIPTLQRKQTDLVPSKPPSAGSHLSPRTERSVSAPHCQPTPVKTAQQEDGRQEVMRELSALRRYLWKEQRQLEIQLGQTDQQENPLSPPSRPRGRPRADHVFESTHKRAAQSLPRIPPAGAARVNIQTIREFNQLKHRDTESREEVRHMFPDPPTDAQSLDIQQQALLREQQRHIRLLRREEEPVFMEHPLSHRYSRNPFRRHIHRDSMLPSETTFIDVYGGDACEDHATEWRPTLHSAERQQRTTTHRNMRDCNGQSMLSVTHLNLEPTESAPNQHYVKRQGTGDLSSRSALPGEEVDVSSLRPAPERRVSVDTVATEPWLWPGTSEAVKESGSAEVLHPG